MHHLISTTDWAVIGIYLVALIALAAYLSRRQFDRADYFVGGRRIGAWPVAISVMATQCSTNSILGAPAFVAFAAGGGLVWLQYELALPLAMMALMLFVMPTFRQFRLLSVYAYLERRFDLKTRLVVSGLFLFVRAFATAVTVYSIGIVIDMITGIGFFFAVVLLGVFTLIYDVLGGMRGVIYSDVIQMIILVSVLALLLGLLLGDAGGFIAMLDQLPDERRQPLNLTQFGLHEEETFAFWPMLIGGFFLYLAYYGCDQSQAQRLLSTKSIRSTNQALLINGLLRFPLVALYCLLGAALAVYAMQHPQFLAALPVRGDGTPEYNLSVPLYMLQTLPTGLVGLAIVALFAAAMSSLDSVINSLSATTMEDFVYRFVPRKWSPARELFWSRLITVGWGVFTLLLSFHVEDIAPTVLEAINKIGSLANGPVLAVFALGLFTRKVRGAFAIGGLSTGLAVNVVLWIGFPQVSWLWWNAIGFFVAFGTGLVGCATGGSGSASTSSLSDSKNQWRSYLLDHRPWILALATWFIVLLMFLAWLQYR